jgi:nickel superoxide dismutase
MKLFTIKPVYAHCDVPCGIYETDTMMHAAATVKRMVEKIQALGELDSVEKHNNFIRMVDTKEKHAQVCKDQLYLLWSDFFKPEHLEKFPNIHNDFWMAAKQCGKVKQTVSLDEAQKLVDLVHEISHLFADASEQPAAHKH